jgi:Zn-dependent peptidase ImmA (M78 family)
VSDRSNVIRARLAAPQHTAAIFDAAEAMHPGITRLLRTDPITVIANEAGIELVILTPQEKADSKCSIAGMYFPETEPPRIGVASAIDARMRFTVIHEFAHHIQQNSELADVIGDGTRYGSALEERACDLFAAEILLPADQVAAAFADGTPSAAGLQRFYAVHDASREAVCVAATKYLEDDGYVMVMDAEGTVTFSSVKGDLPPIGRRSDQSESDIGRLIRSTDGRLATVKSRFRFTAGANQGEELWAQAAQSGNYWFVVASRSRVPWQTVALPSFDDRVRGRWWTCELCGHQWENFEAPHDVCGTPVCPACGRCSCRLRMEERDCPNCFLKKPAHLFQPDSTICDDCAN